MHAAQHEVLHALVVVGRDDLGREAAGGVLQTRPSRPHQEIGVHGTLRGALEQPDGALLTDDPIPHSRQSTAQLLWGVVADWLNIDATLGGAGVLLMFGIGAGLISILRHEAPASPVAVSEMAEAPHR
jgi:hypothetical protein